MPRINPKLRPAARVKTFIKSILTEDRIKWLEENEERIKDKYKEVYPTLSKEEMEEIYLEKGIPFEKYYSKRDFIAKVKEYGLDNVLYGNEKMQGIPERDYKLYTLYIGSVISGLNDEYYNIKYRQSYKKAASELGDKYVNYLTDLILDTSDSKLSDMLNFTKFDGRALLPNMGLYYPRQGGIVDENTISDIKEDLKTLLGTFDIAFESEEDFYSKIQQRNDEEIVVNTDNKRQKDFMYAYSKLSKYDKDKYTSLISNKSLIDAVDVIGIERELLRSREHTLRYSKSGNPYMPFIKPSLVRKYYEKKR